MIRSKEKLAAKYEGNEAAQYVEEKTLEDYVKNKGFLNAEEIYNITANLCDIAEDPNSLKASFIWRELKPANIIVASNGKVTLFDYDITCLHKVYDNEGMLNMTSNSYTSSKQERLTQFYKQKNILNIGMVMYFMATGKVPYTILQPFMDESYGDNVEVNLKRIIRKCFEHDNIKGYASVKELKTEIIIGLISSSKYKNTIEIRGVHNNLPNIDRKKFEKVTTIKKVATMISNTAAVILAIFYSLLFERKSL